MKRSERRRWLTAYAPLFIWIVVVLGLGTGMSAMNETSRFIRPLLEFLFPDALPETLTLYHRHIRKFAHFAEYAVLAFLAYRAVKPWRPFFLAIVLVVAVAVVDETNQSLTNSRTASVFDVLLDVFGGAAMLTTIWLIGGRMVPKAKSNPPNTH